MFEESEIVHRYTRRQAIADGVLVDLLQPETASLVKEAGFQWPVAMTVGAFSETVCAPGAELPPGQDVKGRLWDLLRNLWLAVRLRGRHSDRVRFKVLVWDCQRHRTVRLWSHCGPGDQGEPVITVMLEGED